METKIFQTKIKGRHKLVSEYARAHIARIALETTGSYSTNRRIFDDKLDWNGTRVPIRGALIMTHTCTDTEYDKFRKMVEISYPGLCIFNYKKPSGK